MAHSKLQGVKPLKIKWKITGTQLERMLIMTSAALVVALALRGNESDMARYEDSLLAAAKVEVTTSTQPAQTPAVY